MIAPNGRVLQRREELRVHEHRCPTCGQEVPEALQTMSLGSNRNDGFTEAYAEAVKKYPNGYPNSKPWWRHRTGHETGCVMCGSELPANVASWCSDRKSVSSNRRFCSNACRQRAYRTMKKLEEKTETEEV